MIFLLPVFMLGGDYAMQFWQSSWWIAPIFAAVLLVLNIIYFMNRKILDYLENENWIELKVLLEQKIFQQKKVRKMYIRMYISTCIATSAISDINLLENLLRQDYPQLLDRWALSLGLPYLLTNEPDRMKEYFGGFLTVNSDDAGWLKWNYCFALLLKKETDDALPILTELAGDKKDKLLRLSSLYMLSPFKADEKAAEVLDSGRAELRTGMTKALYMKELDRQKENVQMLFISKIFDEAVSWLFEEAE